MDNDSLNKFLHVEVMGNFGGIDDHCAKCGLGWTRHAEFIDYTSSLDLVAEVEQRVIEKVGAKAYIESLGVSSGATVMSITRQRVKFATASALDRARACAAAWKEK